MQKLIALLVLAIGLPVAAAEPAKTTFFGGADRLRLEQLHRKLDQPPVPQYQQERSDPALLAMLQQISAQNQQILMLLIEMRREQNPSAPVPQQHPPQIYMLTPPQAPQPQLIYLGPRQDLGQPGYPKQDLGQPGYPKQDLGQPGHPKQDLGQPGLPKQDLGQPGQPRQDLGQPGTPQKPLTPAPAQPMPPADATPAPMTPGQPKQPLTYMRYTKQPPQAAWRPAQPGR